MKEKATPQKNHAIENIAENNRFRQCRRIHRPKSLKMKLIAPAYSSPGRKLPCSRLAARHHRRHVKFHQSD